MAKPKLKVNLYQVVRSARAQPLAELFSDISAVDLEDRVRRVGYHDIRLEHIAAPGTADNPSPYWLLDFIRLRYDHGPGKVGKRTAIEGFELNPDEGFGEETAALYDPEHHYLLVQYNHHGVRATSIRTYCNEFFHGQEVQGGYDFKMKLNEEAELRLADKNFITKLHFKVAPQQLRAAHLRRNVSLQRALEINDDQDGASIEIKISAERGQSLARQRINSLVSALKQLRDADKQEGTAAVAHFTLEAKAELEDKAEKIDMLMPALVQTIDGLVLGERDRRYTLESRWEALKRARRGWDETIED